MIDVYLHREVAPERWEMVHFWHGFVVREQYDTIEAVLTNVVRKWCKQKRFIFIFSN